MQWETYIQCIYIYIHIHVYIYIYIHKYYGLSENMLPRNTRNPVVYTHSAHQHGIFLGGPHFGMGKPSKMRLATSILQNQIRSFYGCPTLIKCCGDQGPKVRAVCLFLASRNDKQGDNINFHPTVRVNVCLSMF